MNKKAALRSTVLLLLVGFQVVWPAWPQSSGGKNLTVEEVLKWPPVPADHRMAYGKEPLQYGELRIPKGPGPHPVAVIIHGGCWLAKYNLDHIGNVCAALTRAGVATWSLEYRRVGDPGGGWPGTFQDIARGTDHLRALARLHHLDVERVVAVGHSAGGQLALWLGARGRLPKDSPLYTSDPLPLRGVVSLAGVTDLRKFRQECGDVVGQLLGGAPESLIESRYALTSPIEMLPFGVAQRLIHGDRDQEVSLKLVQDYEAAAKKKGDDAELIVLEGAGHFELIAPPSSAWPVVQRTVLSVLKSGGK